MFTDCSDKDMEGMLFLWRSVQGGTLNWHSGRIINLSFFECICFWYHSHRQDSILFWLERQERCDTCQESTQLRVLLGIFNNCIFLIRPNHKPQLHEQDRLILTISDPLWQQINEVWRRFPVLGHAEDYHSGRHANWETASLWLLWSLQGGRTMLWNWHHTHQSQQQTGVVLWSWRPKFYLKDDLKKTRQCEHLLKRLAILRTYKRLKNT